jgi:hypothetical protein
MGLSGAEPARGSTPPERWAELRDRALRRLQQAGEIGSGDTVVWERDPGGLALRFPGSRGSLYGAASNSRSAAFQRPGNRVDRLPGLYLASGTAHPGGGMPLALASGRLAAAAALQDLGWSLRP